MHGIAHQGQLAQLENAGASISGGGQLKGHLSRCREGLKPGGGLWGGEAYLKKRGLRYLTNKDEGAMLSMRRGDPSQSIIGTKKGVKMGRGRIIVGEKAAGKTLP